jgi:hypothetical protein
MQQLSSFITRMKKQKADQKRIDSLNAGPHGMG